MTRQQTSGDLQRAKNTTTTPSPSFTISGRHWYPKGRTQDGTRVYVHLAKPEDAPPNYHVSTPAHNGYRLFWLFIVTVFAVMAVICEYGPDLIRQALGI